MFYYCYSLKEVPQLNTENGTDFSSMFSYCYSLETILGLDMKNCLKAGNMFSNCYSLSTLHITNIGQAYLTTASANYSNYTITLNISPCLTHNSLIDIINNLYDIKTKGCNTQKLVLGSVNLSKLTESEIAIATTKGWTVS